jgi:glycosyl transferase family 25
LAERSGGNVLILEDDCDFTDALNTFQLPETWDILYGGYEPLNVEDPHSGGIVGAHFMGFSNVAVKKLVPYLQRLPDLDFPADHQATLEAGYDPARKPEIDGAYVWFRRAHPELRTVFATPKLGYQRPSRTDVSPNRLYDRLPLVRNLVSLARSLRRRGASVEQRKDMRLSTSSDEPSALP